jgi:hypothetical protein
MKFSMLNPPKWEVLEYLAELHSPRWKHSRQANLKVIIGKELCYLIKMYPGI